MIRQYSKSNLQDALRTHFGFDQFLEGQEQAIQNVCDGRDVVVTMPTGSGKSLCYQLWSMISEGITIVVSPLISLMKDQVDGLLAHGLPATFINSALSLEEMRERMSGIRSGQYKLVYVAPERFRNQRFIEILAAVHVSLIAVDEAHCISQWGHDFRPDYLQLRRVVEGFPHAQVMALTATATPAVREDVVRQLGLTEKGRSEPAILVFGFARSNLHLAVTRCATHAAKCSRIHAILAKYPTGIIYCSTRKQTERVFELLKKEGIACRVYHGGKDDEEREKTENLFMSGRIPVVVATNAFGMGVDRSDLRCVIHWDIPGSVEAYYQEVGRAGRDGDPAHCELLYNFADVRTQEFFIDGANPTPSDVENVWNTVKHACHQKPVTCPIVEWTEMLGSTRNGMMVRTSMAVLERAGLIKRYMEPGSRSYTTDLIEGANLNALQEQFVQLTEKRARDERKLKDLLDYVGTSSCRHAHILRYFGDPDAEDSCDACDRCVAAHSPEAREPTAEEWVIVQKVLSCGARLQGRFGVNRLIQVLLGSKAKQILDWNLDRLPTYGILRELREPNLRRIVEELIRDRCLRITPGEYPLVEITERGKRVMWKKEVVQIEFPNTKIQPSYAPSTQSQNTQPPIVEALKTWRLTMAKSHKVPAYTIIQNATLVAIASEMPNTLSELENVHGMGPIRVEKYGDSILELLDQFRNSS